MSRKQDRVRQHELAFRTWGGARRGAGRKRKGTRARVIHAARPEVLARHPLHVTVHLRDGLPSLRCHSSRRALERAFARGAERFGLRLAQYAILSNHLHLVVEAKNRRALTRGLQGLLVRVARALNALWRRAGAVFDDRYHARALGSPRDVRRALVYVLHNARHHGLQIDGLDAFTSGAWFDG